jgi:hypothetical protein
MIKNVQDGSLKVDTRLDHRVAVLEKDGRFACIALTECAMPPGAFVLGRSDHNGLTHSPHNEGRDAALRAFAGSLRTSIENGWRVVWSGFPFGQPRGSRRSISERGSPGRDGGTQ